MLVVRSGFSSLQPRPAVKGDGGVDVRVQVGIVGMHNLSVDHRVEEAFASGDHPRV